MTERRYTLRPTRAVVPSKLDLERELNLAQRRAVETDARRVLILAGAGSGKTRTLTYRVARLIEKGAPPEGVVLVTFTNRAAREMVARIDHLLGRDARRVRAGTFHGLGHAALRRHGGALGLQPGFGIVDREDQTRVMAAAIGDAKIDPKARRFPSAELLVSILSLAREGTMPVIDLVARRFVHFAPLEPEIEAVLEAYTKRKRLMNVVDFDDLLVGWHDLVGRDDDLGRRLRSDVHHVLVDEYQDTNQLQAELAERLASERGSLTVVGDDAQSIYAFRGAAFENILDFPRRAKTEVHTLTESYRSTPEILRLANEIIRHNPLQFPKALESRRAPGVQVVHVAAADPAEEAAFVAQRVLELRDEGVPLAAQAVLYRAHSHGVELQLELARRDVPFVVRSGVRFLEQAHVKDTLAFLRIAANPRDELAWLRVLAMLAGVGSKTSARVLGEVAGALEAGRDPFEVLRDRSLAEVIPSRAARPLARLGATLHGLAEGAASARPGDLIRALLEDPREGGRTLLAEHLEAAYTNAEARTDELRELAELADRHEDLDAFLSDVVLVSELSGEDAGASASDEREWLTLSTVHQAKGLEWRAVFVVGLADGAFPIQNAFEEPGGEAEERRLFYVAVTRAMEQLYLSHPGSRLVRDRERILLRPSRFLTELDGVAELLERWLLEPPP